MIQSTLRKLHFCIDRSDEKSACASICDKMGLKGYQVCQAHGTCISNMNNIRNPFTTCILICHFQIGKTKIFLRAGQMAELDARRTEVLAAATRLIQRQIRTYLTRKEFLGQKKATIFVQKLLRGLIL